MSEHGEIHPDDVVGWGPGSPDVVGWGPGSPDVVGWGPGSPDVVGWGPGPIRDVAGRGATGDVVGSRSRPLSRRAQAALPLDVVGAGMLVRRVSVRPADV